MSYFSNVSSLPTKAVEGGNNSSSNFQSCWIRCNVEYNRSAVICIYRLHLRFTIDSHLQLAVRFAAYKSFLVHVVFGSNKHDTRYGDFSFWHYRKKEKGRYVRLEYEVVFIQWLNNSCNSHLTEAAIVDCPWDSEATFVNTYTFKDTFITQRYLFYNCSVLPPFLHPIQS